MRSFSDKCTPKKDRMMPWFHGIIDPYVSEHPMQLMRIASKRVLRTLRISIPKTMPKMEVDVHPLIVRSVCFTPKLLRIGK